MQGDASCTQCEVGTFFKTIRSLKCLFCHVSNISFLFFAHHAKLARHRKYRKGYHVEGTLIVFQINGLHRNKTNAADV